MHLKSCISLVSTPVLAFPDCRREFVLDTDASDVGIGAVLSQIHTDGQEHVVAYASRVLSKAERKYSVICRELLCFFIIFALTFWVKNLFYGLIIVH